MTTHQQISNTLLEQIKNEQLSLMSLTLSILNTKLSNLSPKQANQFRENPDGWTITEVVCHLRDFDEIFRNRAQRILQEEYPTLLAYDQNQLAIYNDYASQNLVTCLEELAESRKQTISLFSSLEPEQLLKAGLHPERGDFTLLNQMMQEGVHESKHIHQICRILAVNAQDVT